MLKNRNCCANIYQQLVGKQNFLTILSWFCSCPPACRPTVRSFFNLQSLTCVSISFNWSRTKYQVSDPTLETKQVPTYSFMFLKISTLANLVFMIKVMYVSASNPCIFHFWCGKIFKFYIYFHKQSMYFANSSCNFNDVQQLPSMIIVIM